MTWILSWFMSCALCRKVGAFIAGIAAFVIGIVWFVKSQRNVGREQERAEQTTQALQNVKVRNEVENENRDIDPATGLDKWMRD